MLKKDYKSIDEEVILERECGHLLCDFDDYNNDLRQVAEVIGVDMVKNEDEEWTFKTIKDKERVKEALNYYYSLH